jgi:arylsulfatase A
MATRWVWAGALLLANLPSPPAIAADPARRPNVVVILADDFGYECVRGNGGTSYQTPHLDALAASGVRFTHAYATPLCTPSRVQLMTGRYNCRNYVRFGQFPFGERTFSQTLRDAGYATFIAGKWQLGGGFDGPGRVGFDGYCLWQVFEQNKGSRYASPKLHANGRLLAGLENRYGEDVFREHAEAFVTRHRDRPFLVYWPMALTHAPFEPTPDSRPGAPAASPANFPDMVAYLDKTVGAFVAFLERSGLRENTLIVFTGDNGTGRPITSTLNGRPIRGDKGHTTTAGTHVPLIASWPAGGAKGRVCDDLIDFTDFLPTLVAAGGAALPAGVALDGRSFLPQVRGQAGSPREWVFGHYEPRHAGFEGVKVRYAHDRRHKLYHDGRSYDTTADPLEQAPLAADAAPAVRRALQAVLDRYEREVPFGK